jgi:hypothetical protein
MRSKTKIAERNRFRPIEKGFRAKGGRGIQGKKHITSEDQGAGKQRNANAQLSLCGRSF